MKKLFLTSLVLLTLVLAGVACGGGDGGKPTASDTQETTEVPRTVLAIEEDAEDAIDMVFAGNWDRVADDANSIATSWSDFATSPEGAAVINEQRQAMDKAISDLKDAAESKDGLAARQAANDVSKVIVDVFDLFAFKIPSDVGRLDYLERQVIIDTDRGDWNAVNSDVDDVRQTFDRVESGVIAAGGDMEARTFEASVARQERLSESRDQAIVAEANNALELVDALESVY